MAGIQATRFGYGKQLSHWQQLELRRERSKALREDFEAKNAQINSAFSSVGQSQMEGAGELAAKAALKRIQKEAEAKQLETAREKSRNSIQIWKNVEPPTSIKAGGSDIDLTAGILTLSDGTRIDLKTGGKVPQSESSILTLSDGTQIDKNTGHKIISIVA